MCRHGVRLPGRKTPYSWIGGALPEGSEQYAGLPSIDLPIADLVGPVSRNPFHCR